MKNLQNLLACAVVLMMAVTATAETTVTLSKMHLCCGKCVKGVQAAIKEIDGISAEINAKKGMTVLTASNDEIAQKALDAIASAGFHAKTDNKTLKMKMDSGVEAGTIKRIELTGIHNCCGACNKAIVKALTSVEGVSGNTAKPNQETLVVEGEFEATDLIKALYKAGFHAKAKK